MQIAQPSRPRLPPTCIDYLPHATPPPRSIQVLRTNVMVKRYVETICWKTSKRAHLPICPISDKSYSDGLSPHLLLSINSSGCKRDCILMLAFSQFVTSTVKSWLNSYTATP